MPIVTLWLAWIGFYLLSDMGDWQTPYFHTLNASISLVLAIVALPIRTYWARIFIILCVFRAAFEAIDSLVYFSDSRYDVTVIAFNCMEILVMLTGTILKLKDFYAEHAGRVADACRRFVGFH